MTPRFAKLLPAATFMGLVLTLTAGITPAQQPLPGLPPPGNPQPAQPDPNNPADPNQAEVLARGPIHEAYAATAEAPVASPVVAQQPPEAIEELPPEDKPEGDNVLWISGYWHWDDDADRYIWISGFWRVSPPGRLWVPGSWREVRGGYQWVAGFWQEPAPVQPQQPEQQPEIQYLPQPPESIEIGPTTPATTATSFYVPGSWVWRNKYLWRPGVWIEHRPNWVWVPAHYRWSPVGYIFVDGYWDYPLAGRGVLYAPMYFPRNVYAQPTFVYTPAYVVSEPAMVGALFVRRGFGGYYFGDYFAPRYSTVGFTAWCGTIGGNGGFAVGFGVGRAYRYDPLWNYYSVNNRRNPDYFVGVNHLYGGRYNGTLARPPVNLVQQNTVINKITNVNNTNVNVNNVTNNITVVNKNVTVNNHNVTDVAMLAPAKIAKDLQPEAKIKPISAQVRKEEAGFAKQTRDIGVQRAKVETAAVAARPMPKLNDPPAKGPVNVQPQTLKLEVPKTVVAKTRIKEMDETKAPPANPHRDPKAAAKVDPKVDVKPDLHPVFTPKANNKVDPKDVKIDPKVNPKDPKVDPKVNPKVDPKIDPKDPLPKKVDPPKVDPLPKKIDPPKVDPLPKKIDPPKVDPLPKKVDPPKVDPLPKKVDPPKVDPLPKKVDPPKVDPLPKKIDPPKVDPLPKKVDPPKVDPLPKKVDPPKVDPLPKKVEPPKVIPKVEVPKVEPKVIPKVEVPKVEPKKVPPVIDVPMVRVRPPVTIPSPVPPVRPVANLPPVPQPAKLPVVNPVPVPRVPVAQPRQPVVPQPKAPQPEAPPAPKGKKQS
ncbi:MAG: hypothetical protein C0467_08455 [Planctomycetaceae bacterium]|nr:hypothetical protein [Planctomycetaceae bacterium]